MSVSERIRAYRLVYGEPHDIDNYFDFFKALYDVIKDKPDKSCYEVLFTDKPLFSDTYRFDRNLITGPYMHNKDKNQEYITAKDFFSYNITRETELFRLVTEEFETLGAEAGQVLEWDRFDAAYNEKSEGGDGIKLFRDACVKREKPRDIMNKWKH